MLKSVHTKVHQRNIEFSGKISYYLDDHIYINVYLETMKNFDHTFFIDEDLLGRFRLET